jgi:hypothetical protein
MGEGTFAGTRGNDKVAPTSSTKSAESRHLHAAPTNGVVRHKPIGSGSLWERNEFGLVAGHLREAAFLPVLLGLLDPVL